MGLIYTEFTLAATVHLSKRVQMLEMLGFCVPETAERYGFGNELHTANIESTGSLTRVPFLSPVFVFTRRRPRHKQAEVRVST